MKTYLKLSILCIVVSLFFNNCEKDDHTTLDESQLNQTTPLVINQTIPFEQSLHFNKVASKIGKLQTKISNVQSQNKTGDEDITIVTDEVLYITYASTHTYTFKVLRAAPQFYIENIVLHYDIENQDYREI